MKVSDWILEEWTFLLKSKRMWIILLLVPLFFTFLFGSVYSGGKLRLLPVAFLDEDHSELSRQVMQAFDSSEVFSVREEVRSEDGLVHQIELGEAEVGVVIPKGFEKAVTRGERGELMTIIDGSNIMVVNSALNSANEIVQTFSGGISIKRVEAKGLTDDSVFSLRFAHRMLYNPGLSYSIFMPLGLVSALVQQVLLLAIALSVVRYKPLRVVPLGKWIYAKTVPYFWLGLFLVMSTMGILIKGYDFPFVGQTSQMLLLTVLFVFALVGLGMLISAISPNALQATQISMLLALLSFPLSGYTWPFISMPKALVSVAHVFPLTYYLDGLQKIAVKGSDWIQIQGDLVGLLLIAAVTFSITWFLLKVNSLGQVEGRHPLDHN
ncbi:ABC transporter permease [Ammoniphilus resinae]|uniref:ABC-2 type transport system permease protein n=1 Tax=Ammoniphilus resinae TaxID=861532 RepID=A0ABS4GV40_9BACL|nr:ABC transporter permease [Ammoniphilus resinae]MBP1934126.1 ABC-2 type transport system permease protein [Ammoniphilus resinae]